MEVQNTDTVAHNHKLSLNLIIKGAQNNHGLKRGDYQQYRQYCSNKIKKIRKQMKFSLSTKNKFVNRKVEEEKPQDPRTLEVLLFNAEKNWAHGNQIKDQAKNKKISKGNKNKHTTIKKFRRALDWATRLEQICQQNSEKKAAFQAQAYKLYLQGLVSFQTEQFSSASQSYIKCRQILKQLQKISDSVTSGILKQKIDQIQASIRYCTFMESKGKQLTINQILDLKKINDPTLMSKLQNLSENKISSNDLTIQIGNNSFPIKNPAISSQYQKIQQIDNQVLELVKREQNDQQSHEIVLQTFGNLFVSFDELIRIIEKEKENTQYTQAQKQNLSSLALHFQENKLSRMLQRLQKIFIFSYKIKKLPPQTLAKLLSNMMGLLTQTNQLQKDKSKLSSKPVDMNFIRQADDLSFFYRSLRLHLVAQVYFNNKKTLEAYSLWVEAQRCIEIIKSKQNTFKLIISTEELQKLIRVGRLTCMVELSQKQSKQQQEVTQGIKGMKLNEGKGIKEKSLQYLIRNSQLASNLSLQELGEFQAVKLPPGIQMIPPRPIFFDLIDQHLSYPSLEKKQEKKGGFWSKFKLFN